MCGRFSLSESPAVLAKALGLPVPRVEPRYNIAPMQPVVALVNDAESGGLSFQALRWGLVPFWARDASMAVRCINAKAETVHEKPTFRAAFRHRRCLVPASGFYEWRHEGKAKTPFYFSPANPASPLVLAGIWEDWTDGAEYLRTLSILTTAANATMRPVHDRMPVLLPAEAWRRWLDAGVQHPRALADLLTPYPDGFLRAWRVSPYVNKVGNEGEACIEPA